MWSLNVTLVLMCFASVLAQDFSDPQTYINQLKFSDKNFRDAFAALKVKGNKDLITEEDLDVFFHHEGAKFAKEKFLKMVDTKPGGVTVRELAKFMNKDPVKLAVHECIYIRSRVLRRFCLGDQILTYVYLLLDQDVVNALFIALDSKIKDEKLDIDEIKALREYDGKFNEEAAKYFMTELGRGRGTIDQEAFSNYVKREDLNDNFRGCKNDPTKTPAYDDKCLIKALMHYTMYDVTEYMTALLFSDLNKKVQDYVLSKSDLLSVFGSDDENSKTAHRFFEILDHSKDETVTYGEFRSYIHSHSIKLHMEKACLRGENIEAWNKNRDCLKMAMWDLIKQNHRPMMMSVPDLQMVFLFEQLDKSQNGKIEIEVDLVGQLHWEPSKAQKFVDEIDGAGSPRNAHDGYVTLEEFNNYVDEPNMVFGLGDCLIQPAGNTRLTCFVEELDKILLSILDKTQVKDFRQFYDKKNPMKITRRNLETVNMQDKDEIDNFLRVLGMGDETITEWEFTWFVKQQELSERFKPDIRGDQMKLHNELRDYLKLIMTEYDTQELFRTLDKNKNFELDREDFDNVSEAEMLSHMNLLDDSGKVSFLEFWLFLNTPSKVGTGTKLLRKRVLETECTEKYKFKKDLQVDCYRQKIQIVV